MAAIVRSNVAVFIFIAILCSVAGAVLLTLYYINRNHERFVYEHSICYREICAINNSYRFKLIPSFDMFHNYDEKYLFDNISPEDYLTYHLIQIADRVKVAIADSRENFQLYSEYHRRISNCAMGRYDTSDLPLFSKFLLNKEKEICSSIIQRPPLWDFRINVTLRHSYRFSFIQKQVSFDATRVEQILENLSKKESDFFLDDATWQSISRVERGWVSSDMRNAVMRRDNFRCKYCGSERNLEVDHIFPISKGGKSTFDNLQVLCHRCNYLKSNKVNYTPPKTIARQEICPICGGTLVVKNGRNGRFYGCSNYPECRYTKGIYEGEQS